MTRLGKQDGAPLVVDLTDQSFQTLSELWAALIEPCGLPPWFGCNLDAWHDALYGGISPILDEHPVLVINVSSAGIFAPGNRDGQAFIDVTNGTGCAEVRLVP